MTRRPVVVAALAVFSAHCRSLAPSAPPAAPPPATSPAPSVAAVSRALAAAAGFPVEVLRQETRYRFSVDGTKTRIRELELRVVSLRNIDPWARMSVTYRPWFEARPELSATVTTPDGQTFTLDPSTIAEAPVEHEEGLLTDARRLIAPLPALVPGARIVQRIVEREDKPFFSSGTSGRFWFGMSLPVLSSRLILEIPRGLPLVHEIRGIDIEPVVTVAEGITTLTFDAGTVPGRLRTASLLPRDTPRRPYVAFSTVPDWRRVAGPYHQLVRRQLQGFDARSIVKGIDRRSPRRVRIAAVVARLHELVRYTGVEFGERSVVPWTPAVTLSRRFGDCKDKALLLIAMLRAVGFEADLALVRSGFDEDIRPALPGLEPFNHAIVRVAGGPEVWVDVTAPLASPGQLPTSVQGRWALVVSPEVNALLRLPESPVEANRYVEHRTVTMSDWGPVDVVERTSVFGSIEERLRRQFADSPDQEIKGALERYTRTTYRSRLSSYQLSDPKDMKVPFEIELHIDHANIGVTSSQEASVRLTNAIVFNWLPDEIRQAALATGADDMKRSRRRAYRAVADRRRDLEWAEPYRAEVRFRIQPPRGYSLRELPESRRWSLGPGTFEAQYRLRDDGGVDAAFVFDLHQRRYTADELRALVAGLEDLWDENVPMVHFDHEGARLLGQGKLREGIGYYRALANATPGNALHQARLAEALLKVNLGDAARAVAARAVALQPDSPYASYILAWVLQHDQLGRAFKPGFDRQGAIAAYQRVLELQADNLQARKNLAEVLEHDRRGRHYADPAGVDAAIGHYRTLSKHQEADDDVQQDLLMALFRTGRCAELSVLAPDTSRSLIRDGLEVTCAILLRGRPDGLRVLDQMRLPPAARQAVIEATLQFLVTARAYDEAKEVALMAIPGASDPVALESQVRTLDRLKPYEEVRLKDGDPGRIVQHLYEAMFDGRGQIDDLSRFFARDSLAPPHRRALEASLQRELVALSRVQDGDTPHTILRDSILSLTRFSSEGDDEAGYRVTTRIEGGSGRQGVWFVVKERGAYRIRGGASTAWLAGHEALALVARRRLDAAARWLTWGREVWGGDERANLPALQPFFSAWPAGPPSQISMGQLRTAAALLAALGPGDRGVVKALRRARREAPARLRPFVDHATFLQFDALDDDAGRLRTAARIRHYAAGTPLAQRLWARALVEAERYREAEKVIRSGEGRDPEPLRNEQLVDLAIRQRDFGAAQRLLRRKIADGKADDRVYNNLAWWSLFRERLDDEDLGLALRANSLSGFKNPGQLHTLAALYAETGRAQEAMKLLQKRLELLGRSEPSSADWYVIGRVYEHFELFELAARAYGRVQIEPHERAADSTHTLAQRKLRDLKRRRPQRQI